LHLVPYLCVAQIPFKHEGAHLIEVGLQGFVLCPLHGKLSLGRSALVLGPLLALVLLHSEQEADNDENERNYEQL
jgi:hypothetical protein